MNFRDTGTRAHGAQRAVRRSSWKAPSRTVTWYFLGKPRSGRQRRRWGRSGNPTRADSSGRSEVTLPRPDALPVATPGGFISRGRLPRSEERPDGSGSLAGCPAGRPLGRARHTPAPCSPSRPPLSPGKLQRQKLGSPWRGRCRREPAALPPEVTGPVAGQAAGAAAVRPPVAAHPARTRPPRVPSARAGCEQKLEEGLRPTASLTSGGTLPGATPAGRPGCPGSRLSTFFFLLLFF